MNYFVIKTKHGGKHEDINKTDMKVKGVTNTTDTPKNGKKIG